MQLQIGKISHNLYLFQGQIKQESKRILIKVPPLYLQIGVVFIALGLRQRQIRLQCCVSRRYGL